MPDRRKRQHRYALRWFCVVIILLCLAGQARARQNLGANGPVSLAGGSPDASESSKTAPAIVGTPSLLWPAPSDPAVGASAGNQPGKTELAGVSAAGVEVSATEARPLGTPRQNSVSEKRQANEGGGSVLGNLDPRQNEITRVLAALAAVIGLMLVLRTVLRRANALAARGARPSGVLEILARYPVSRGQQLVILKLARRIILLHQTGSTMSALCEITDADEVAGLLGRMEAGASERDAAKFRSTLNDFIAHHDASQLRLGRSAPGALARIDSEIVDLTRSGPRSIGGFLRLGGSR